MRHATTSRSGKIATCLLLAFALQSGSAQSCSSTANDPATHTKVGQQMPAVTVKDTAGNTFSLASQKGKVVLVNFWATWCGPCQFEIPRLEKEIWQKYKSTPNFAMVAIAREQTTDEIAAFQKRGQFTYPIASDPKRSTYALFADSGIPRSYVVDANGKILFQTVGYCAGGFDQLKREIERGLAKVQN
jgi:peroxiredoxin